MPGLINSGLKLILAANDAFEVGSTGVITAMTGAVRTGVGGVLGVLPNIPPISEPEGRSLPAAHRWPALPPGGPEATVFETRRRGQMSVGV